jgi:peptide/nickel transport system permease protein
VGPGVVGVAIALGVVGVPNMARIARSATLTEREAQYIEGARSVGVGRFDIVVRHLLPNIAAPIMVQVALFFVHAVLTEAGLSFLGLGVQLPLPSLGSMLNESRSFLGRAPWFALVPGITLTLLVLSLNILADHLAALLDPRR